MNELKRGLLEKLNDLKHPSDCRSKWGLGFQAGIDFSKGKVEEYLDRKNRPTYHKKVGELEVELNIDGDLEEGVENINELVEETTVSIEEMTEAMQKFGELLNE